MDILSEDFCAWLGDARRDMERDLERRKEALEDQQRVVSTGDNLSPFHFLPPSDAVLVYSNIFVQ
ncbi:MAG: hypothetical protein IJQ05_01305 [Bacteroidaceae bacterium]|nr:hypothetical protein [Bacteroidaceae bacterium]